MFKLPTLILLLGSTMILGTCPIAQTWASPMQALVASSQALEGTRALLESTKGTAALARAMKDPAGLEELTAVLGKKEVLALEGSPEAARAALLRVLNSNPSAAIIKRAASLVGTTSSAGSLGATDPNLDAMRASVEAATKRATEVSESGYTADAGFKARADKARVESILDALSQRVKDGDLDERTLAKFRAAAEAHPDFLGDGLAKACGTDLDRQQLENILMEFAKTRAAKNELQGAKFMIRAMAARQGISRKEAAERICKASEGCKYVRFSAACSL